MNSRPSISTWFIVCCSFYMHLWFIVTMCSSQTAWCLLGVSFWGSAS
uniref:Uncharacterized protein n=1 Tax=Aegilops tauschii subsp. strangulata TaxID=200361 RepID=A0A453N133_AEGTS